MLGKLHVEGFVKIPLIAKYNWADEISADGHDR